MNNFLFYIVLIMMFYGINDWNLLEKIFLEVSSIMNRFRIINNIYLKSTHGKGCLTVGSQMFLAALYMRRIWSLSKMIMLYVYKNTWKFRWYDKLMSNCLSFTFYLCAWISLIFPLLYCLFKSLRFVTKRYWTITRDKFLFLWLFSTVWL